MEHMVAIFIGLIFLSGLLATLIQPIFLKKTGLILAFIPFLFFLLLAFLLFSLSKDQATIIDTGWGFLPEMTFSFRVDGLSLIFGMLINGIGILVLVYSSFYMAKYKGQKRFFAYLLLFMGAMLGLVFSNNLMVFFIFWEITSITSFLLIGFNHHLEKSRQAALQALLITALGGLCLLFFTIMTGQVAGTYQLSELYAGGFHFGPHPYFLLFFGLLWMAAATKSAQFPFHFWLPGAMQAPTPVSAYLHSATMVNAGIFLLLRLNPILGGTFIWKASLIITGGITMFLGAFFSLGQKDLKRILAYTTISALGTMVLLIGMDTTESIKAALVFFIVHALYKGGLFMIAGIIEKNTGTRDISKLGGLLKHLPLTSLAAILALLSMAGLPPMLGFISKELIYDAKIQLPGFSWLVLPLGVTANIMMVAISLLVFYEIFLPRRNKKTTTPLLPERKLPFVFLAGPIILAILGLALGLFPGWLEKSMANALFFIQSQAIAVKFSFWHGFNQALLLSIFTVVMGIMVFMLRHHIKGLVKTVLKWFDLYHLPILFTKLINNYLRMAEKNANRIQHGYHRYYLLTFFGVTLFLVLFHLFRPTTHWFSTTQLTPFHIPVTLVLIISSLAVIFAVLTRSGLSAILSMGVLGYGIATLYMFFGAVDLAITQFLVETIVMIIFVMVIYHLPDISSLSGRKTRIRDAMIAFTAGIIITIVVLKTNLVNTEEPVSRFFAENSHILARGRNIVNVILVDFRALDTLGEITVLALAAAGVYALLKLDPNKKTGK